MGNARDFSKVRDYFLKRDKEMRKGFERLYNDAHKSLDKDNRKVFGVRGNTNFLELSLSLPVYFDSSWPDRAILRLKDIGRPETHVVPYDLIYTSFNHNGRIMERAICIEPENDVHIGQRVKMFTGEKNWRKEVVRNGFDAIDQLFELMSLKVRKDIAERREEIERQMRIGEYASGSAVPEMYVGS